MKNSIKNGKPLDGVARYEKLTERGRAHDCNALEWLVSGQNSCLTSKSSSQKFVLHGNDGLLNEKQVIIETTGLADPAPVAQTFFADDYVQQKLCPGRK